MIAKKISGRKLFIVGLAFVAINSWSESICHAKRNIHVETEFAGEALDRGETAYRGVYNLKEMKKLEEVRKKEMVEGSKSRLDDEVRY